MTTTSRLPLPGRSCWSKLCACPDCNNRGHARRRKRSIKRAQDRQAQHEIDTERYEDTDDR